MKIKICDDTIVIFSYILSGLMLIGQLSGMNTLTSNSYALSFVIVFLLWMMHIKKLSCIDIISISIITISLICVIATCEDFYIGYFKNWVIFATVFLFFSTCFKIKLKAITVHSIFKINRFLSICCIFAYILRRNEAFYITNTGIRYLIFDFYNPNVLALFLVCIMITGLLDFDYFKGKLALVKEFCYIVVLLFLIILTRSRTSLIAAVLFIAIRILFKRKKSVYLPKNKLFCIIVSIFPLAMAVGYLKVIDIIEKSNVLSFLVSEGKRLDSRQYVWEYALSLFKESPVIGSYQYMETVSEFSQMHNSHLNILVSYGTVVLIMVIVFLYLILCETIKNSNNSEKTLPIWAFIICLLLGAGESILFSGGLSFYLLTGQFLLLNNACTEDRKVELN